MCVGLIGGGLVWGGRGDGGEEKKKEGGWDTQHNSGIVHPEVRNNK